MKSQKYIDYLRSNTPVIEPGQEISIVGFDPKYAKGIASCYYLVYSDTFPMSYVYEPDEIVEAFSGGKQYCLLAVTPKDEVVGIGSMFTYAPNHRIWEAGSIMLINEYRKDSRLAMSLVSALSDFADKMDSDAIYGLTVCNHKFTQISSIRKKYAPTALEIDSFTNFQDKNPVTTSLHYFFKIKNSEPMQISFPSRYIEICEKIYGRLTANRTVVPCMPSTEKQAKVTSHLISTSLKIQVEQCGEDLMNVIEGSISTFPDSKYYHVNIPLHLAGMDEAVEKLHARGYVFGGILPLWNGTDCLMMQKLNAVPNYENIVLYDALSLEMLELIKSELL